MKVVIVGGGAGGISTASNIRKLNKEIEITVITRDNKVAYSPCAIPYVLSGTIESFDDIVMRTPEDYKNKNIDVIVEAEVTAVDSDKKTVTYVKDGSEIVIEYDKLVLEVTTDGSIHPKDALKEAAKILIYHFMLFSDEKITLENNDTEGNQEFDEEVLHMRQLLKTKLTDMNLSVRALNCLKAADVETLGDLVQYNKTDLLKFRNFGKKSLTELDDLLESLNLSFGTDIAKYKLDKE